MHFSRLHLGLFPVHGFGRVLQAALRHVLQVRQEPGHVRDHDADDTTDDGDTDTEDADASYPAEDAAADLHAPVNAE